MLVAGLPPFVRDSGALRDAVVWAEGLHADQRRDADRAPFILHPLEVAALLHSRGYDEEVIVAGVLHDLLEATDATGEEVRARFGERVAGIVLAVTEDPTITGLAERKAALRSQAARSGPDAIAVYAADKVAKVRELRGQINRHHGALDTPRVRQRLEHYELSLAMLRQVTPDHPFVGQLAFELWALHSLPPGD
jgi:(p)ppGpp synthase/HD superfamily hydrolase